MMVATIALWSLLGSSVVAGATDTTSKGNLREAGRHLQTDPCDKTIAEASVPIEDDFLLKPSYYESCFAVRTSC